MKNKVLNITPKSRYISRINDGKPVGPMYDFIGGTDWCPPIIDIKIVNNSILTKYITKLKLNIEKSRPTRRELPVFYFSPLRRYPLQIIIRNLGWADMYSSKINFNIIPLSFDIGLRSKKGEEFIRNKMDEIQFDVQYSYEKHIGTINGIHFISLEEAYRKKGLVFDSLRRGPYAFTKDKIDSMGPFKTGTSLVYGKLHYSIDKKSESNNKYIKFATVVHVYGKYWTGASKGPSSRYDIKIYSDSSDYTISKPVSIYIKPGNVARFTAEIFSLRSSYHDINISLITPGGAILSAGNIEIKMLVPTDKYGLIE